MCITLDFSPVTKKLSTVFMNKTRVILKPQIFSMKTIKNTSQVLQNQPTIGLIEHGYNST